MAPKATPAAKESAATAASATEMGRVFRNFKQYAAKQADPVKAQEAQHLSQHFAGLSTKEKKTFVQAWYQRCGSKGDLGAFMRSELESTASSTQAGKTGFMYPGQIADDLKMKSEYFPTMDDFVQAIRDEIAKVQTAASMDPAEGVKAGSTFWTSQFWFSHMKATETAVVNTTRDTLGKSANQAAGREVTTLSASHFSNLMLEGMGDEDEVGETPGEGSKESQLNQKRKLKVTRALQALEKTLSASQGALLKRKTKREAWKDAAQLIQNAEELLLNTELEQIQGEALEDTFSQVQGVGQQLKD
eukprot:6490386-Amphidinium_carterae.1